MDAVKLSVKQQQAIVTFNIREIRLLQWSETNEVILANSHIYIIDSETEGYAMIPEYLKETFPLVSVNTVIMIRSLYYLIPYP